MNVPTKQSKAPFDLNSSTRITLTTVASLMLSHLGRNVALSRPISLLDIKDDDNVKPASQPSSEHDGWWAHSTLSWEKMESHKNKVVEMGSKSSALKGSSFVCTMTVLLVCCLPRKTSKKSSSSSKVDHPLVSRNFLWGHSEVSRTPRTLEARSLTTT